MNTQLFCGEWVRLVAPNPESDAESVAGWSLDSEFTRLFGSGPARLWTAKRAKEEMEKDLEKGDVFIFHIRTLADDRVIGIADLDPVWSHGDAWLGIGIGERDYWGKGYGTDAVRVLLRYAFAELNLFRVTLNVFEHNRRAIRSYEKAGFVVEGRVREVMRRDGRRSDVVYMGILQEEWRGRQ
jgi:RimJ/RimL family protein N-acetyltransferase